MGAIRTVLVANRGEIACRIQRTCKQLSIRTAVVFTEADRHLPFVQQADIACCIGEGAVEPSYLNIDVLLEAATRMNADAVHPGYGFLAENAQFAQRVLDAGLIWIGPPPSAIAAMGDKIEARAMASAHNVPVVPGTEEDIADPEQLKQAATHIGFPLLVNNVVVIVTIREELPAGRNDDDRDVSIHREASYLPDPVIDIR